MMENIRGQRALTPREKLTKNSNLLQARKRRVLKIFLTILGGSLAHFQSLYAYARFRAENMAAFRHFKQK